MTVGMLVRTEGIVGEVGGVFKMDRRGEAVVTLLPRKRGMVSMKSLPRESDFDVNEVGNFSRDGQIWSWVVSSKWLGVGHVGGA